MDEHCRLSFRHLSTISNLSMFPKNVMGSEASEKHFGSSGGVRGGIWGCPGGVWEASWEVLGLSGGVRGASWEGLGRSWGDLGATFGAVRFRIDFLIDFDAKRVPKGRHLGSQNGAKIDPKTRSKSKREKVASWKRLGSILRRLGVVLAPFGPPKCLPFGTLFALKIDQKSIRNRTPLKVAPRSPQDRPRPSQDASRTPPDTPRSPQ